MYLQMLSRESRTLWEGKIVRAEGIINVLKPGEDSWAEGTWRNCSQPSGPK